MSHRHLPAKSRRVFLTDFGKATLGLVVLGVSACSDDSAQSTTTAIRTSTSMTTTSTTQVSSTSESPTTTSPTTTRPASTGSAWERAVVGNVSAYVLVRAGEAVVIDTGNPGGESAIETALSGLGVTWGEVGHVILTHDHGDHIGSLAAVMAAAPDAAAYAGAGDIPDISAPRPLIAVGDGDSVAGLDIIATPGHTPGHIAILNADIGLLVAGDAVVGQDGGVGAPVPRFAADLDMAHESVSKLGGFAYDTIVFGHGEPVMADASSLVAELAANL